MAVAALAACTHQAPPVDRPSAPVPVLSPMSGPAPGLVSLPWRQSSMDSTGRHLLVELPGGACRRATGAQVDTGPAQLTVTIWGVASSDCPTTGVGVSTIVGVDLPEPLGSRRLVHGAT
ncbi:hypothetical protein [Krasilnikovia sp. MM14-A1259]|uniref:hypothetical protein n=1 Tax=Krasilnikovia sp. MM14-A1259 TaxID=3373539 RepID=UPI00399C956D